MLFLKKVILISGVLLGSMSLLDAKLFGLDFVGRKADRVEEKRVEKKLWKRPEDSSLFDKSFPIKKWDKHFSSLGSKRAPITVSEKGKKELYKAKVLDRKTIEFDMARWNNRMADLHKRAAIQMDDKAQIAADHQLYGEMLKNARQYGELREKLSIQDLNRYQFRRNRSSEGVPVQKAGSGGE